MICGLIYPIFSLLVIFVIYILNFFEMTFILGMSYGVIIAVISHCDKVKRTIVTMVIAILSAVVSQFILFISGAPYKIIFYIYRNDTWVQEIGRLSVNEVIGYNLGSMIFGYGLLITCIGIILYNIIKSRPIYQY